LGVSVSGSIDQNSIQINLLEQIELITKYGSFTIFNNENLVAN